MPRRLGRQVSRTINSASTDYWFDASGLTLESSGVDATYLRDPRGLLLSVDDGSYALERRPRPAGSITKVLTAAETIARANRYDPDGNTLNTGSGPPNRLRFLGQRRE